MYESRGRKSLLDLYRVMRVSTAAGDVSKILVKIVIKFPLGASSPSHLKGSVFFKRVDRDHQKHRDCGIGPSPALLLPTCIRWRAVSLGITDFPEESCDMPQREVSMICMQRLKPFPVAIRSPEAAPLFRKGCHVKARELLQLTFNSAHVNSLLHKSLPAKGSLLDIFLL